MIGHEIQWSIKKAETRLRVDRDVSFLLGARKAVMKMGAAAHGGAEIAIILIGLIVAGVLWLIAWLRNR
jgi:hypothetical protein